MLAGANAASGSRGAGRKESIYVVFENGSVVSFRNASDLLPAAHGHRDSGGIVQRWRGVQNPSALPARVIECLRVDSFRVHRQPAELQAGQRRNPFDAGIRDRFGKRPRLRAWRSSLRTVYIACCTPEQMTMSSAAGAKPGLRIHSAAIVAVLHDSGRVLLFIQQQRAFPRRQTSPAWSRTFPSRCSR